MFIKKGQTTNEVFVVNGDKFYPFECVSRNCVGIISWRQLISLFTFGTIAEDPVE